MEKPVALSLARRAPRLDDRPLEKRIGLVILGHRSYDGGGFPATGGV
ncbi:hypothetical protein ABIA24_005663 [Sinorhizobium fredii]